MLDPSDVQLRDYIEGTESTQDIGSGEWGRDPAGIQDVMPRGNVRIWRQYNRVLGANDKLTFWLDDRPDYWQIRCLNIANNGANVYPYSDASGEPLQLLAGDKVTIPGVSQHLTIVSNSTGCTVNVVAMRGYDLAAL